MNLVLSKQGPRALSLPNCGQIILENSVAFIKVKPSVHENAMPTSQGEHQVTFPVLVREHLPRSVSELMKRPASTGIVRFAAASNIL